MSNFLETPRFPDDLAFWALGGVSYNTVIVGSTSGREQRNVLWTFGRGQWDLQNCFRKNGNVTDPLTVQYLRNFFRLMKGQAYGFRFRDFTDYLDEGGGILGAPVTNYANAPAPTGKGSGASVYQLYKQYLSAPLVDYRLIQKPLVAVLYRNGAAVTFGAAPGNASLDTTTGLVTFVPDAATAASAWTPGATTSFTAASTTGFAVGKVVSFTGVTGDTAGVLNGATSQITNISGTTVTVNANTTGLTLTGGTLQLFPQASDTLTWTGTFDTPCRFATDRFAPQMDVGTGALYGFQSLSIAEIRL